MKKQITLLTVASLAAISTGTIAPIAAQADSINGHHVTLNPAHTIATDDDGTTWTIDGHQWWHNTDAHESGLLAPDATPTQTPIATPQDPGKTPTQTPQQVPQIQQQVPTKPQEPTLNPPQQPQIQQQTPTQPNIPTPTPQQVPTKPQQTPDKPVDQKVPTPVDQKIPQKQSNGQHLDGNHIDPDHAPKPTTQLTPTKLVTEPKAPVSTQQTPTKSVTKSKTPATPVPTKSQTPSVTSKTPSKTPVTSTKTVSSTTQQIPAVANTHKVSKTAISIKQPTKAVTASAPAYVGNTLPQTGDDDFTGSELARIVGFVIITITSVTLILNFLYNKKAKK